MALSKKITYPNGTETNYHKIIRVSILSNESKFETNEEIQTVTTYDATIIVNSYVSNTVRATGINNYVIQKTYSLNLTAEIVHNNCIMHLAYDLLKTQPEFADAEDV